MDKLQQVQIWVNFLASISGGKTIQISCCWKGQADVNQSYRPSLAWAHLFGV